MGLPAPQVAAPVPKDPNAPNDEVAAAVVGFHAAPVAPEPNAGVEKLNGCVAAPVGDPARLSGAGAVNPNPAPVEKAPD